MDFNHLIPISEEWLQYAIRLNVLHEPKDSLKDLRQLALQNDKIQGYLNDVCKYHSTLVTNHKNPELPIHKLIFLLELGFDTEVKEIQTAINEILKNKDEDGVYLSITKIPKHFGGTGEETFSWCLCDAPLLLLALVLAKVDYKEYIKTGVDYLVSFYQGNGFPCTVSKELGKFRGPGKKGDCCPYATLLMLRLLLAIPEYKNSKIVNELALILLTLWETSLESHPYMFYMGTNFRKLKAPNHWYDIVSVTYLLSQVDTVRKDNRFQEMVNIIKSKSNENGTYTPESVYQKLKGWDFGQKKTASPYLTYMCYQIITNVG